MRNSCGTRISVHLVLWGVWFPHLDICVHGGLERLLEERDEFTEEA